MSRTGGTNVDPRSGSRSRRLFPGALALALGIASSVGLLPTATAATGSTAVSSPAATPTTAATRQFRVGDAVAARIVVLGSTISVSGTVRPTPAGSVRRIQIQRWDPASHRWLLVHRTAVSPTGRFAAALRPARAGTYRYRAFEAAQGGTRSGAGPAITVTVTTRPRITTTSLPAAVVGNPFAATLQASGGAGPYDWSATGLPAGLTLTTAGALHGTPTTAGARRVALSVVDVHRLRASALLTLTVTAPVPPRIVTSSLPAATVGTPVSRTLSATAGTPPYRWTGTGLPAGVTLSASGLLAGTPTTPGTASLAVAVTDARGNRSQTTLSLLVNPAPGITTGPLAPATVKTLYSVRLQAVGGTGALVWSPVAGSTLPAGLILAADGTLAGTPTAVGTATVGVRVTDTNGAVATAHLVLVVYAQPAVASAFVSAVTGQESMTTLTATGGTTPLTWALAAGSTALPSWLHLAADGVLDGTPQQVAQPVQVTVEVTDANGATATSNVTISVTAPLHAETVIADWAFAEGPGATTAADSSGNGHTGSVGSKVVTGAPMDGSTGYLFDGPTAVDGDASDLVSVPYAVTLNPGLANIHLSLQVQTTQTTEANFMQHGQAGAPGGFYKIEMTGGQAGCYVAGVLSDGTYFQREAWSGSKRINDGAVHTLDCYKTSEYLEIDVDGVAAGRSYFDATLGNISVGNYAGVSIGGKGTCTKVVGTGAPNCDYVNGLLRDVRIAFAPESADID